MKILAMAWRGVRRDLRAADVRALLLALTLAVAATTMIGFFLDRVDHAMARQAGQLLGGDLVLVKGSAFDDGVIETLEHAGMTVTAQTTTASMAGHGDQFQLASLKAVNPGYPLYGEVTIDRGQGRESAGGLPAPGHVWIEQRLGRALGVSLGEKITLGDQSLTVSAWVLQEPDQDVGLAGFNPSVMLSGSTLATTHLIQPGSRATYRLLAKGTPAQLASLDDQLDRWRDRGIRVMDVREDRPRIGRALERSQKYLSLAGLAAVLLAGVAVAMATRRYVDRHLDTAALMRCFGARQRQLVRLFAAQLALLALLAAVGGALLGLVGQWALLAVLTRLLPLELPPPGPLPLLLGVLTAMAVLVGFAGPTLLRLRQVSALKVLRRELDPLPAAGWLIVTVASLVFGALLWLYSRDFMLSLGLLLGGLVALAILWWVARGLLAALLALTPHLPLNLRLGGRQLARRRSSSLGQIIAFAVTFALMALITLVRSDLITQWQEQLPADAPNQFAINIQPSQRDAFIDAIDQLTDQRSQVYPIVRGRLVAINGETARDAVPEGERNDGKLQRETNLTWSAAPPANNPLSSGEWFGEGAGEQSLPPISVAQGFARDLGLALGDRLTFDVAGQEVSGQITSLREVDWESFRPNFFVIFPPGALSGFSHTYITSFYLNDSAQQQLGSVIQRFPSVSLLDIDAILGQVRNLLGQVAQAIELILGLVLLAGIAVLYAALTASRPARAHEGALLRVFGAGNRQLARTQASEFLLLGLASGLLGAALTESTAAVLYAGWLDFTPRWHLWLWLTLPLGGALLIGGIGYLLSRPLRRQAPMASLQLLGEA
ncbi:ABC transporter permease [Kushneria phosphatilytica]|uniref:FtsX-like permease family protein n=1 Tax=Kushneria phosphatilytica TaxID=657387 RepID=A0A1S1NUD6_9GAMM|nr:FtsX-like permease family protein [Kushneria phosphatilytica]OHV09523.1 ABC transporter permease [Kushneria phosphatilytica]QEL11805.1 FtsX-like permease family protein [Kushneria phosphatilytica]